MKITLGLTLGFLTLIVAGTVASISLVQLQDAKRAFELNAVTSVLGQYDASRVRYNDALLEYTARACESESSPDDPICGAVWSVASLNLWGYLQGIELACRIYVDGFIGEEFKKLVADHLSGDLWLLVHWSYNKATGYVGTETIQVPWIKGDGKPANAEYPFSATGQCLDEWEIYLHSAGLRV